MLRLIVLATALVCVLGAPRVLQRPRYPVVGAEGRIIGGDPIDIEVVPWQLSLEKNGEFLCGASIISPEWAISSATCLDGSQASDIIIHSGSADRQNGRPHIGEEIVVNAQFDLFSIDFDVAVLRVNPPFRFDDRTAPVDLARVAPAAGTDAFVSGWGYLVAGDDTLPRDLQGVSVPIYDQEACNVAYAEFGGITDQMICAGLEEGGVDACQGDSGGPLTVNGELVGIVSWGKGCAEAGYPGVYSNVAVLSQWVIDNTQ